MALTKAQGIMKALIEETLRRQRGSPSIIERGDVTFALEVMKMMLPPGPIFVLADSQRFATDFSQAIRRPCTHLYRNDQLHGQDAITVIQLHTGMRTAKQQETYDELSRVMKAYCRHVTLWHLGEWREWVG